MSDSNPGVDPKKTAQGEDLTDRHFPVDQRNVAAMVPNRAGEMGRLPPLSPELLAKWQGIVDWMAKIIGVPAGLIMRVDSPEMEILSSSATEGNPYHKGERVSLNTGRYCETVMAGRSPLFVPDARKDPAWDHNPDLALGMVCFLGVPVRWPDDTVFGTLCVLDRRENPKVAPYRELVCEFGRIMETDLLLLIQVAERKRAEESLQESEEQYHLLAEALPQIVWITRADGWNIYFNQQWVDYTGMTLEESYGHGWNKPFHPDDRQRAWDAWQNAVTNRATYSLECQLRRFDGSYRWWLIRGVPVLDENGKILKWFGTCTDIDDLKKMEEEILHAKEMAEAANKAKSIFLANMSHELRTPLNAILGFSNMVGHMPDISSQQRTMLNIINRSGDHLLNLINDVLDMAKIEAGRIVLEVAPFDLGEMLKDIRELMRRRADEKGLMLLFEQTSRFPRFVRADAGKLRQVFINLLGNAIKYTERGGVTLRASAAETDRPGQVQLLFEVEDSGVGIAAGDLERIFEPFVQVGALSGQEGSGLGLAITRQYLEVMGGSIRAESTPGKGSLFRVELTVERAGESDIESAKTFAECIARLAPGQPEFRILIVEDQMDNQLLLQHLMESTGFQVRLAENGAEALDVFASWRPHLIWMDRRMPVMDGMEATRRIRALEGGKEVKIVALTASVFAEQRDEFMAVGMDDFIRKPYKPAEIYDCLKRNLGIKFVCEDASLGQEEPKTPLSPEAFAALPTDVREQLEDALVRLDVWCIQKLILRIAELEPALGVTLTDYAGRFAYTPILHALRNRTQTST